MYDERKLRIVILIHFAVMQATAQCRASIAMFGFFFLPTFFFVLLAVHYRFKATVNFQMIMIKILKGDSEREKEMERDKGWVWAGYYCELYGKR